MNSIEPSNIASEIGYEKQSISNMIVRVLIIVRYKGNVCGS